MLEVGTGDPLICTVFISAETGSVIDVHKPKKNFKLQGIAQPGIWRGGEQLSKVKTPLDVLKERNRLKRLRLKAGPLAFLEDLNRERKQQRQRDSLLNILRQPPMSGHGTLIIGARCKDGIVIASDRKVARESEIEYTNKVFELDLGGPVLFAAEGLTGIRDDFFLLLNAEMRRRKGVDTLYEVKVIVEDIIANLTERYAERVRDPNPIGVLMGGLEDLTKGRATFYYIHAPGYGESCSFICTGHGGSYAHSLAKFLIDPNICPDLIADETAKRVAFVISWVAKDVDSTVGGVPQVTILRDNNVKTETLSDELTEAQQQAMVAKRQELARVLGLA